VCVCACVCHLAQGSLRRQKDSVTRLVRAKELACIDFEALDLHQGKFNVPVHMYNIHIYIFNFDVFS